MKNVKLFLNDSQLDRLSEFMANLGLVLLASVLAPLISGVDGLNPFMVTSGLVVTIFCLLLSLYLLKGAKK